MSSRAVFLQKLKAECEAARNGRYFVKRGVINWSTFPFDTHPFAIALVVDDFSFADDNGFQEMRVSLEVAARMPDDLEQPEIDDGLLDELTEDAERALQLVIKALDANQDAVVLRFDARTSRGVEFHDTALRVQGVVITFFVVV